MSAISGRRDAVVDRIRTSLPAIGWAATALTGSVAISQTFGFTWIPLVWTLQSLTPYWVAVSAPLAIVALVRRRRTMGLLNVGITSAIVWIVAPIVFHPSPGTASADAPRLTVAAGNVFVLNDRPDDLADTLLALDADVIALTEFSSPVGAAMLFAGAYDEYPHVDYRSPGDRDGIALFSRYPITDSTVTPIGGGLSIDATLDVDGTAVRIVVVHPRPATDGESLEQWLRDIPTIGRVADPDDPTEPPTIVVGDFNATRWHPAFRHVLDRGWRDAHEVVGRGWSRSWPTDRMFPPLVRIDHALVSRAVVVDDVVDLHLPGSDHAGFVVTVALPR